MEYIIEKNIALTNLKKKMDYPLDKMEIGDSFFIKDTTRSGPYQRIYLYLKSNNIKKKKYSVKDVEGGCCVWRIL